MKEKILTFLREQEGFVSGQRISEQLGVSRTAVWKYIKMLKEEGYEIESVTRKGYRLLHSPDLLTLAAIRQELPEGILPGELRVYGSIDSTNEEAKRRAAAGAPDGSVYVADIQTAGKGRRGRPWISPGGEDIFFSLLYKPDLPVSCVPMVTLVAAMSAVFTVEKYAGEPCSIKWPNDIVLHGHKMCGILTEMGAEMEEILYLIIGIGFNLNRDHFDEEIADIAGSIRSETGKTVNRAAFFADFIRDFQPRFETFVKEQSLGFMREAYNAKLINAGREVRLDRKGQDVIARAIGINDRGELVVEDEQGNRDTVFFGEVSVRGLYGYV